MLRALDWNFVHLRLNPDPSNYWLITLAILIALSLSVLICEMAITPYVKTLIVPGTQ